MADLGSSATNRHSWFLTPTTTGTLSCHLRKGVQGYCRSFQTQKLNRFHLLGHSIWSNFPHQLARFATWRQSWWPVNRCFNNGLAQSSRVSGRQGQSARPSAPDSRNREDVVPPTGIPATTSIGSTSHPQQLILFVSAVLVTIVASVAASVACRCFELSIHN